MKIPKLVTAEYSISQDCFHIQDLSQLLEYNMRCSLSKFKDDWHLLGVFETESEAHRFIEAAREAIQGKEMADRYKRSENPNEDYSEETDEF